MADRDEALETEVVAAIAGTHLGSVMRDEALLEMAREAIAAYNTSFKRDLAERGITMKEFREFLIKPRSL